MCKIECALIDEFEKIIKNFHYDADSPNVTLSSLEQRLEMIRSIITSIKYEEVRLLYYIRRADLRDIWRYARIAKMRCEAREELTQLISECQPERV